MIIIRTVVHSQVLKMIETNEVYKTNQLGFSQAIESEYFLFTSGQVGWDTSYQLTGDKNFEAQVIQALKNTEGILEAGNSNMSSVIFLRIYVKNLTAEKRIIVTHCLKRCFAVGYKPATSLIGIESLASEELLVEIETIAMKNKRP